MKSLSPSLIVVVSMLLVLSAWSVGWAGQPAETPRLFTEKQIQEASTPEAWQALKGDCERNLGKVIGPDYAGWGWRGAVEQYAHAYVIAKRLEPARAAVYGKKAIGLMKVLARDHMYGCVVGATLLGQGDGARTAFELPQPPLAGGRVEMIVAPVKVVAVKHGKAAAVLGHLGAVVKVSNTASGSADYDPRDYRLMYRDAGGIFVLHWNGAKHPNPGDTYHVSLVAADGRVAVAGEYELQGRRVVLKAAPKKDKVVLARCVLEDYSQTGNGLGGLSSVQPDGPGYPMRTMNVGLAYAYDLLRGFSEFTPELKKEFYTVLNEQVAWYTREGYSRDAVRNNYYIRGYLAGALLTGWGTEGDNPQAGQAKKLGERLLRDTFEGMKSLPGGTSKDGQYAAGVAQDLLDLFALWKEMTGEDLAPQLLWTSNLIPYHIHAAKPDGKTSYDGGDWSELPAQPLRSIPKVFLRRLPAHPMAPYARQFLKEMGEAVPPGEAKDWRKDFPLSYRAPGTGPAFARSDWSPQAIWWSLEADRNRDDHDHRDEGHLTIQRGADYLLVDAGGYGQFETIYQNTVLFDDRGGQTKQIIYAPNQGVWGKRVEIRRFEDARAFVFAQADYGEAYAAPHDGARNSVKKAWRSVLYLRPDLWVVHDQTQVFEPTTKMIFNLNFRSPGTLHNDIYSVESGQSKLFLKVLIPAGAAPVVRAVPAVDIAATNYQTTLVGKTAANFLHVLQATDNRRVAMASAELLKAGDIMEGAEVESGSKHWVVLFAVKDDEVSGPVRYQVHKAGTHYHVITDLKPRANYKIAVSGSGAPLLTQTRQSSAEGVLSLEFQARGPVTVTLGQ